MCGGWQWARVVSRNIKYTSGLPVPPLREPPKVNEQKKFEAKKARRRDQREERMWPGWREGQSGTNECILFLEGASIKYVHIRGDHGKLCAVSEVS